MTDIEWKKAISDSVTELCCMKYFPTDPDAKIGVMRMLYRLIPFGQVMQLRWLTTYMIDTIGVYDGPAQMREVFSRKYIPLATTTLTSEGLSAPDFTELLPPNMPRQLS